MVLGTEKSNFICQLNNSMYQTTQNSVILLLNIVKIWIFKCLSETLQL